MLYCSNCGAPAGEARDHQPSYCAHCGHPLDASPRPIHATPAEDSGDGWGPEPGPPLGTVPWRSGQVALGVFLLLVALIPVTAIAIGVEHLAGRYQAALAAWVSVHVMGLAIVAVVWRLGLRRTRSPLSHLGLAPLVFPKPKAILLAVGVLGASLGFTAVYGIVVELLDLDQLSPPDITADIAFPGLGVVLTFQALALVTPLTEEVFFRGFVFAGLVSSLGVGWAGVVSALVFCCFHVTPGVLIPVFVTGLLLAWLYHRTGSLWPGVLAHAGQNALAVAVGVYVG